MMQCTEDAAKWFGRLLAGATELSTCTGSGFHSADAAGGFHQWLQNLQIYPSCRPELCKSCRQARESATCEQSDSLTAQDLRMGRDSLWKTEEMDIALLANTVLFDLVLKGAKADAQKLGRLLPVIRDLRQGAPDGFPFDLLQG